MSHDEKNSIKMSGYLEKKSKMKVMSSWKNYWFVLEGRLLLYYKSKDTLSPCKGSINLGPRCTVKPASASTCIFQIETRSNTIILKAPNRLEQEKWLQAILSALNPSPANPNGMVHFRYSSDDLMPTLYAKQFTFTRQYTLPGRFPSNRNEIKQRLQDIGGKTYGGSLETIQKLAKKKDRNYHRKQSISTQDVTFTCGEDALRPNLKKRNTYSGSSSQCNLMMVNDQSKTSVKNCSKSSLIINDNYISSVDEGRRNDDDEVNLSVSENIYERVPTDLQAVLIDNDTYMSDSEILVENEQYALAKEVMKETETVNYHEYNVPSKQSSENIYSIPQIDTDLNDNKVSNRIRNEDVNPYSICQIYPKKKSPKFNEEKLYEVVPDTYDQPMLPPRPCGTANSNLLTRLKKFGFHDKNNKVVKKSSFIKKLFKRKDQKVDNKEDEDDEEERQYVTIDECVINKLEKNPEFDKQVLEELKDILINKRETIKAQLKPESNSEERTSNSINVNHEESSEHTTGKSSKPVLPRKQKISSDCLPFAKLKNKSRKNSHASPDQSEKLKTIDEILNDLNVEKLQQDLKLGNVADENSAAQNVKQLIDKFNQVGKSEEEIILRPKEEIKIPHRHSDELNRLLNELIKVTNAPILPPGVTNSLEVTKMTDDELLVMTSNRSRRYSDPDYDIPRPHSNLQIEKNDRNDGALTATRFFGQVLSNRNDSDFSTSISMTPDSLEASMMRTSKDDMSSSYTSHHYIREPSRITPTFPYFYASGSSTPNVGQFLFQNTPNSDMFMDSLEPTNEKSTIL